MLTPLGGVEKSLILTRRVLEVRRPVVQLYAGVLAAPCEPQHVVAPIVDLVLEFTDRLARQTHVVDDVQRPVDLPHIATAVQSLIIIQPGIYHTRRYLVFEVPRLLAGCDLAPNQIRRI